MQSKEQLIEQLKEYKRILNKTTIDYLNDLINLDYSAIRDDIIDKSHLDELDIYRKISIYNIYNRTMNIIKDYDNEKLFSMFDVKEYDYGCIRLKGMDVFGFYYGQNIMVDSPDYGFVNLYRYPSISSELEKTNIRIELLNYEKNMFDGICSSNEKYEREAEYNNLQNYCEHLKSLDNDDMNHKISYINECANVISKDYGLISPKCLIIKKPGLTIKQYSNNKI